ncbi:MAG: hypothetical protein ACOYYU_06910 [Chloroflexota bacterium]
MTTTNQPFWKDEPDVSFSFSLKQQRTPVYFYVSTAVRAILLIAIVVLFYGSPIVLFVALVVIGIPLGVRIYIMFWSKNSLQSTGDIQKLAQERIGASHIGSAVHVAGHPLLQRDQSVVLAITGDQLNIYSYEKSIPLDSISLKDIQTFHTVSYDDDRVPHIDAIDSMAQALQLSFFWREQPCTCLFRRMRKMKAIDWYQAIQQTRLQLGLAK